MNTLSLQKLFHNWPQTKNLLSFIENDEQIVFYEIPYGTTIESLLSEIGVVCDNKEIEGISGSVTAFFAKEFSKKCLFVVPSEKDCAELILDLTTVFTDDKGILQAEILTLPWWGMVPYRACAKGAVVFVHGICEHLGRYNYIKEKFVDNETLDINGKQYTFDQNGVCENPEG